MLPLSTELPGIFINNYHASQSLLINDKYFNDFKSLRKQKN